MSGLSPKQRADELRSFLRGDQYLADTIASVLPEGAVILTAEEAEKVRMIVQTERDRIWRIVANMDDRPHGDYLEAHDEALTLLSGDTRN